MSKKSLKILLWISFITGILVFSQYSVDKSLLNFIICIGIAALYSFVIGIGNGVLNDYLNRRYSWVTDTKTRSILGIVGTIILNIILVYFCNYINYCLFQGVAVSDLFSAKYGFANWIIINFALLVSAFLHAKSFVEDLKKTSRKEVVEQKIIAKSANAQFESLKNQLDPHFLFNSLNVLSSLIDENPAQAQKFTASMSKIYRYVLEQKDKELVSVDDEIQFGKIYAELLKTRFEDSVDFSFNIPDAQLKFFVVPLSLQLLLENCIKHNFATTNKPLNIKIYVEDQFLIVENNLQIREQFGDREGIGLSNIVQRYSLLSNNHVFIEKSDDFFKVKIPIITELINHQNMKNIDQTSESLAYKKASKRVKEIKGFYGNLISYSIVISFLICINLLTSPDHLWFFYPMVGWGLGLAIHALNVFAITKNWEEKKIKELMEKDKY